MDWVDAPAVRQTGQEGLDVGSFERLACAVRPDSHGLTKKHRLQTEEESEWHARRRGGRQGSGRVGELAQGPPRAAPGPSQP